MNRQTKNIITNIETVLIFLLLTFVFMQSETAFAQNGINTPYSRYGFGIQADRANGFNKGMAGVAQGFRDGQIINAQNPASYSAVDSLTALFDFGLSLQNGNYKMGNLQQNAKNTSLDYAAFHFRAARHVGVALGILPYTNIGYSFSTSSEQIPGDEDKTSSYTFNGDGGLHQVFLGAGWQPLKQISIGFNVSYLYGNYSHTMTNSFNQSAISSLIRGYNANISTYMLDFGLQYIQPISKKDKFVLGFTFGMGHDIDNCAKRYTETFNNSTSTVESISGDTISNAFQLPESFTAGITYYHANKLKVGADFELQKWSECRFPLENDLGKFISETGALRDKMKISIGTEYIPNISSTKYIDKINYKFGAYYSETYAKPASTTDFNKKPTEFGISAGVTLPISNRHTWYNAPKLNLSLQWTHTDIPYLSSVNHTAQTLKEDYLRLSIGLTISERWFYKWKVE